MKKCPYCGAEYPDDLVVCPVDQTPFDKDYNPSIEPSPKVGPVNKLRKYGFFWQLIGGIIALFFIDLQELHFDVFSDTVHFKKAMVKLWVPLLLSVFWLYVYFRYYLAEDE
jgi:hypothetical protein